ncbi:MAG: DUF2076 domain-containing protein [Rhodospirillaceae bacterium]
MTPQERDLISDLFRRLRDSGSASRDQEADALIRRLCAAQPEAAYLLVQTTLVQEQALHAAQARIEELQQQVESQAARPVSGNSFLGAGLGGLFGSRRQAAAPPPPPPPQTGPWGAPAPAGGGFLQSALTTAAGVAGGALLFEGIQHLFGGSSAAAASPWSTPSMAPTEIVENTTINNYYGDQSSDSANDSFDTGADGGSFFDDV